MSAILKFDFQKRKQLHFSIENNLNKTKKSYNFAYDIYIFPKTKGNKNKLWAHLGTLKQISKGWRCFLWHISDPGFQTGEGEDIGIHQSTVSRTFATVVACSGGNCC